ncbi:hypothetical protein GCM10027406_01790 [Leifsonia lichenia]
MRKTTQPSGASKGLALRAARTGVAAASALIVTATGMAFAAPASAAPDDLTIPVVTSPAAKSTIFDKFPTFSGTSKMNYSGTLYLTPSNGAKFTYCTFKSTAEGTWSCSNPSKPLDYTSYTVDVTVYNKGASTSLNVMDPAKYQYSVTSPGFGATVDTNRPVFAGTARPFESQGAFVYVGNQVVAIGYVDSDGNWTAESFADVPNGSHAVRVDFLRAEQVVSSVNHFITVNTVAPVAEVTVAGPAAGSTVSEAKPVFSGAGEAGASIVVKDANGVELASTTVAADGTWSVASKVALADGAVTATVTQTIGATGQTSTSSTSFVVVVPAAVVAPLVVASPATNAVVDVNKPVYSGTGEPGATIYVKGSTGRVLASATVDASGTWSATSAIELGNGYYVGTVTQSLVGGATNSAAISYTVKVVDVKPFTVTSPLTGGNTTSSNPVFAGVGTPGATVEIRGNSGRLLASTTVDADGNWSATSEIELAAGSYLGSAKQFGKGEVTVASLEYTITKGLTVTPAVGGDAVGPRPVYSGLGQPGATVVIKGSTGRTVASAVVDADGRWSATADFDLMAGRYVGTAVHSAGGVTLHTVAMEYFVK